MHRIEDDLKAALRRIPAPEGMSARILAQTNSGKPRRKRPRFQLLAAAALLFLILAGGVFQYQQARRRRSESALQRTLAALSLAAAQLHRVESKAFAPERWDLLRQALERKSLP